MRRFPDAADDTWFKVQTKCLRGVLAEVDALEAALAEHGDKR